VEAFSALPSRSRDHKVRAPAIEASARPPGEEP